MHQKNFQDGLLSSHNEFLNYFLHFKCIKLFTRSFAEISERKRAFSYI